MKLKLPAVVLLSSLAILATLGFRWGYSRLVAPLEHGRLEIPSDRLNFGTAIVQEDFVYRLPVENRSAYPVEVASFERSCGCTVVTPGAFSLAPYASRWLQLNLDLHGADGFEFSGEDRDFSVDLRPVYAKAMTPGETWRVVGKIRSPFEVTPLRPRFAPHALVAGIDFQPLEFSIASRTKGQAMRVTLAARSAPAHLNCTRSGEAMQVSLTPEPSLAIGDHVFRLAVEFEDAERPAPPPFELRVPGRVVPDVQTAPSHVRLDLHAAGAASEHQTVKLRSRTGTPFEVIDVDYPEEVIEVEPIAINEAPATEHKFNVRALAGSQVLEVHLLQFKIRSINERVGEFVAPLQVVLRTH